MKKISIILLTISLLFVFMYIPVENNVNAKAKTLRQMKAELAKYEKDYQNSLNQKKLTEQEIANINNRVTTINVTITNIGDEVVKLNEEIKALNKSINDKDAQIKQIANFVQLTNGESMYLKYAFGAEDFTSFIYRIAVSEQLSNYNQKLIDEYNQMIEDNKNKKVELAQKEKDLEQEKVSLASELTKLKFQSSKLYEHQIDVKETIKTQKEIISLYQSLGCKDDDDIDVCSRSTTDTSFWRPLKSGIITSYFGMRWHPTLGQYRLHEGMDLGANLYTPVYSAANGKVAAIKEKYWCGGNIIWITHMVNGKKYTTQYQHLASINVKVGQTVRKTDVIGYSGGYKGVTYWDSCSTGAHLHFTVLTGWIGSDYYWSSDPDSGYYKNLIDPRTVVSIPYSWSTRY